MRKVIKSLFVVIIIVLIIMVIKVFKDDYRLKISNELYSTYVPATDYELKYSIDDYVDEEMNTSTIMRSMILGSMINFDTIINSETTIKQKITVIVDVIKNYKIYSQFTQENQYEEKEPIQLVYVGDMYDHNFEYHGQLSDGTEVSGNLAIWTTETGISVAISFQDENGNIDYNKAKLLTDDSNAEMLAYLIIEEIQKNLNTKYEPNEATNLYFKCTLEQFAGSISYHAATSLFSADNVVGEISLNKAKTANISTVDKDGFLVNRSF